MRKRMGEEQMHHKSRKLLLIVHSDGNSTPGQHSLSYLQTWNRTLFKASVICETHFSINCLISQFMRHLDIGCLKISTQTQETPNSIFPELFRWKSFHFIGRWNFSKNTHLIKHFNIHKMWLIQQTCVLALPLSQKAAALSPGWSISQNG